MQVLDWTNAEGLLRAAAAAVIEAKPLLTEIDSAIGDGDHGIGMAGGMQKALAKLDTLENTGNVYDVFTAFGKAMLMSMGGASGVIFGSMFMAGAKGKQPSATLSAADFTAMLREALAAIQERGKAQVGDKTMVDALAPAVDAMEKTATQGFAPMLRAGADAASAGVEATKAQQAKFGRAKSLMERAIGHQDAGATSVYIILRAMADYAA